MQCPSYYWDGSSVVMIYEGKIIPNFPFPLNFQGAENSGKSARPKPFDSQAPKPLPRNMTMLSNPEPEAPSNSTVKLMNALYIELGDDERLVVGEPSDDGTVVGVVVDV